MGLIGQNFKGSRLQFSTSAKEDTCDVVVGFDFGTSCSKVVFQTPHYYKSKTIPIIFNNDGTKSFLLPTRIYYDRDGITQLSSFANSKSFKNLKIYLLDKPNLLVTSLHDGTSISPLHLVVAYIAHVLIIGRQYFFTQLQDLYSNLNLLWHFNLGIPSGQFKESAYGYYKKIAIASWLLSSEADLVTLQNAVRIVDLIEQHLPYLNEKDLKIEPDLVAVIPEVTAEVVSYVRSDFRNDGLHMIIDIGASTLDIAGFRLDKEDGEDKYRLLKTSVRRLGSHRCHQARIREIKRHTKDHINMHFLKLDEDFRESYSDLPEKISTYYQINLPALNEMDTSFYRKCYSAVHRVIRVIREKRDPNAVEWERGLPVFLCGGGQYVDLYKSVLDDVHVYMKTRTRTNGLVVKHLQKPEGLDCPADLFCRLAVAYGLSFPQDAYGEVWPASKIKDVKRMERHIFNEENYIRKEDT